jgi:hypothetical protein
MLGMAAGAKDLAKAGKDAGVDLTKLMGAPAKEAA